MIFNLLSQLIPVLAAGIIAYLTCYLSRLLECGLSQDLLGFKWILEVTPAINTFFMFVAKVAMLSAMAVYAFFRSSKHVIVSLDILYFLSRLLLIIYHNLKQPHSSPLRTA